MAFSQVTVVANQIEKGRIGYQAISLTNFDSDTDEPQIAAGSKVEIGGALFDADANESIAGWADIANSSDVYIHLTVSGASVTASFSTTAPTWDTAKQGWYSGAVRVIGGLYKDGSGNYARKWLYEEKQVASVKRYGNGAVVLADDLTVTGDLSTATMAATGLASCGSLQAGSAATAWKRKVVEIGDWNMDTTASVVVPSGVPVSGTKIRRVSATIRSDGAASYPVPCMNSSGAAQAWIGDTNMGATGGIELFRLTGGTFDNSAFDSTSYNRGWVTFEYEA